MFTEGDEEPNLGATQETYDLDGMALADKPNMTSLDAPDKAYGSARPEHDLKKASGMQTPRGDPDEVGEGA